jgi:hypothetical protein
MPRNDLPAAIEAAELHVQAADGNVEYAATRLRQGWTRRRRPVTSIAKVALPLLAVAWLVRKKRSRAQTRANGLYYMGAMQPVKTNFVMGLLAAAVATRAIWIPVLTAAIAEMQRRRANEQRAAEMDRPAATSPPSYGYPGTAGTANVGSDPRVEAGYH